jgi:hypothetical protein
MTAGTGLSTSTAGESYRRVPGQNGRRPAQVSGYGRRGPLPRAIPAYSHAVGAGNLPGQTYSESTDPDRAVDSDRASRVQYGREVGSVIPGPFYRFVSRAEGFWRQRGSKRPFGQEVDNA